MSTDIVVSNEQALAQGGMGLNSSLFKVKPATIELVQKTTRQEGAEPGKFRITSSNEHFETMKWVLLTEPVKQRQYYEKGNDFSKNAKLCFSLDNVQPHPKAKEAPAPYCATCPKGDVNWEKWRKTKNPADLPACQAYWHILVADRATQMAYYFNVKGKSVVPFEQGMQNLARLLASMQANVRAENREITKKNEELEESAKLAFKPLPNIFDITFPVSSAQLEKGGPWVLQIGKPVAMNDEARAEFGALYLDILRSKEQYQAQQVEEDEANAAVVEQPAASTAKEVSAVIGKTIEGEIVNKEQITI